MLKYKETQVTFKEVPDEVSLCINITNCPIKCECCHSKHLWKDEGEPLNVDTLKELIAANDGITCVCFMGGDAEPMEVGKLAKWVTQNTSLKVAWYSGRDLTNISHLDTFDFVKVGPYVRELGGLDSRETNQRFYRVIKKPYKCVGGFYYILDDITYKFQND